MIRKDLLTKLAADGVQVLKGQDGRVLNGVLMHNSCACFDMLGQLAMSILYHRPQFIGIGNEVFVEVAAGEGGGGDKGR